MPDPPRYLPDIAELRPGSRSVVHVTGLRGRLSAESRIPLARYLRGGTALVASTVRFADPLDADAGEAVSANVVTDGEWVWSEAWAYYVDQYGVDLPQEFVDHARAKNFVPLDLDLPALQAAEDAYADDYASGRTPFTPA